MTWTDRMSHDDLLQTYRRVVASARDEEVYWWYLGTTFVVLRDGTHITVSHPETVMIYAVETVSDSSFKIVWREVGYFRDPVTGDVASSWHNPVTGKTLTAPSRFQEGPATYTIQSDGEALSLSLTQAHAQVRGIDVAIDQSGSPVRIVQRERKVRNFPDQNGVIRDPEEGGGAEADTTLTFVADAVDAQNAREDWVDVQGTYTFHLNAIPDWMEMPTSEGHTVVHGIIAKGRPGEKINAQTWERLDALFPGFFDQ